MAKLALILLFVCASVLAAEATSTVVMNGCTCFCPSKSDVPDAIAKSRKRRQLDDAEDGDDDQAGAGAANQAAGNNAAGDDEDEDEEEQAPPPKRHYKKRKYNSKKNHIDRSNVKTVGDRTENSNNGGNKKNKLGKGSVRGTGHIASFNSHGNTGAEIGDTESTDGGITFGA